MENTSREDKILICKACQKEFAWNAKEQAYYEKRGLKKQPQKCSDCRTKANKLRDSNLFYVHCGICNKDAAMISPPPKDQVSICEPCYLKLVKEAKIPSSTSDQA